MGTVLSHTLFLSRSLSLSLFLSLFTIYRFVDSLLLYLAFFAILSLCALALLRLFASANYKTKFCFFFCARRVDVATLHACHSNAFLSCVLSIPSLFPFIAGKVDLREKDPLGKVANETQHGMHREERTARGSNKRPLSNAPLFFLHLLLLLLLLLLR